MKNYWLVSERPNSNTDGGHWAGHSEPDRSPLNIWPFYSDLKCWDTRQQPPAVMWCQSQVNLLTRWKLFHHRHTTSYPHISSPWCSKQNYFYCPILFAKLGSNNHYWAAVSTCRLQIQFAVFPIELETKVHTRVRIHSASSSEWQINFYRRYSWRQ